MLVKEFGANVNEKNALGNTALHLAAGEGTLGQEDSIPGFVSYCLRRLLLSLLVPADGIRRLSEREK